MPSNSCLDDIAGVIGFTPAMVLCAWYHGRNLYVPENARANHAIETLIGRPAFVRLVRSFHGQWLSIPKEGWLMRVFRDRRIADALVEGADDGDIANQVGVTPERVGQIRRALTTNGLIAHHAAMD